MFESLCNSNDINKAYKLTNLQTVTCKNERKLRSTSLTNVIECNLYMPDFGDQSTIAEEKETLTKGEEDIVVFDNVSDHRLLPQRSCIKCSAFLVETNERLIKCSTCHSIQLASSCLTKLVLKLTKAGKTYTCDSTVLSSHLP